MEIGSALRGLALGVVAVASMAHGRGFSEQERSAIVAYWAEPERYAVAPPKNVAQLGSWQVRLTIEGSRWLWEYDRARGVGKAASRTPLPKGSDAAGWEKWVAARIAWDRAQAWKMAAEANLTLGQTTPPFPDGAPKDPGSAPKELVALLGKPPVFASITVPQTHVIAFDDGLKLELTDNPNLGARYSFYRFPEGVMSAGAPVRTLDPKELDSLFQEAGVSPSGQKVMKAVSLLEGGFDSVNTYDTGFVSVGFIQFACLKEGGGSLGGVLLRQKTDAPESFERDFRRFGIDVDERGILVAVQPSTGDEAYGPDAASWIIADKRLIGVFQRAGRVSRDFRLAQVRIAKERYLPTNDIATVTVAGKVLAFRVGDVIQSESGLATLMDLKVHTGKLDPLTRVVAEIYATCKLKSVADLARYERDIVVAMRHRKNYLAETALVQPGPAVEPTRTFNAASRKGTRNGRGGG